MRSAALLTKRLASHPLRGAGFLEPMECLAVPKLHDGPQWGYEIKPEMPDYVRDVA